MRGFYQQYVSPVDFLQSKHYVGMLAETTSRPLVDTFDLAFDGGSNGRDFVVIDGAISTGKSHFALLSTLRILYELCGVYEPQRAYGLLPDAPIHIALVNERPGAVDRLEDVLVTSPFFKNVGWSSLKGMLVFPNDIRVVEVSPNDTSILGMNVFAAVFDDVNWMKGDNVGLLVATMNRRIKSRFAMGNRIPGMLLCVGSSRRDGVTESLRQFKPDLVRRFSIWSARPAAFKGTSRFRVAVNLKQQEYTILEDWDVPPANSQVVHVPEDYRADFTRDLPGALRDLGGLPI